MHSGHSFHVQLIRSMHEEKHLHLDTELLYVMEGEACAVLQEKEYRLKKDDMIFINSSVHHAVTGSRENMICRITYDYQLIADMVHNPDSIFLCNSSVSRKNESFDELRMLFRELVYQEVLCPHKSDCYKYSILYRILDRLIENFMIDHAGRKRQEENTGDNEKLQKIFHYVSRNFQEAVSLSSLSDQMYMSKSTLSRFFKKQTGIYFADYVSQIRLNYAVRQLLYSDRTITKIAVDCGFANASVFDRVFRENYGMPPTEYRNTMQEQMKKEQAKERELRGRLRAELQKQSGGVQETAGSGEMAEIQMRSTGTLNKNWNRVINIGSVCSLTLASVQQHLLYLSEHLGFVYARMWTVFDKRLMICDGISTGVYNYDALDSVFDFLVSNHIIPFLDFSKRPSTAVRSAGDAVYFKEDGIDFKSRRAWEAMLEDFVVHMLRRYGEAEVSRWIFEITRDPTHQEQGKYYEDENYSILTVYLSAYRIIRRLLPGAEIGGLGGIPGTDAQLFQDFFEFCIKNSCVPDFVSFILFPYVKGSGEDGNTYIRSDDKDYERKQTVQMRQMLHQAGLDNCRLYAVEWNHTVSNRNFLNDSCFRGAYMCRTISEIQNSLDLICVWMGSDWVSSYYDSLNIVNGGSGLLAKDGIPKPAFYALEFLNQLGSRLVMTGENYIITKGESGSCQILCFHFGWYSAGYFLKKENAAQPHQVKSIFHENQTLTLNLKLNGMEDGEMYVIKKRSISQEQGSILDEWGKFQYETHLERSVIKYLQAVCIPHLEMEKRQAQKSGLRLQITLKQHEFALYQIYREK